MRQFKKMALLLAPVLVATSVGCATQSLHVSSFKFPTKQKHATAPSDTSRKAMAAKGKATKSAVPKEKGPSVAGDRNSRLITLAEKHERDGNIELAKKLYHHLLIQQPDNTVIQERLARLNSESLGQKKTLPTLEALSTQFASNAPIAARNSEPQSRTSTTQRSTQTAAQAARKQELLAAMTRRQQANDAPGRISLPSSIQEIPLDRGITSQESTVAVAQASVMTEQAKQIEIPGSDLTVPNTTASVSTTASSAKSKSGQKASTQSTSVLNAISGSESLFFEEVSEPTQQRQPTLSKAEDLLDEHLVMEIVPEKTEELPAASHAEVRPVFPVIVPKPKAKSNFVRSIAKAPEKEKAKTIPVATRETPVQVEVKVARDAHHSARKEPWWDSVFEDEMDAEATAVAVKETEPAPEETGYDWEPISLAEKFDPRVKSAHPKVIEIDTSSAVEIQSVTKWTPTGKRADQANVPTKKHDASSAEFSHPLSVVTDTPILQQAPPRTEVSVVDINSIATEDQSWRSTSLIRFCDGLNPNLVPLVRMLDSENEFKRITGLTSLANRGTEARAAQDAIHILLADPSEIVQAHAAVAYRSVSGDALRPIAKLTQLLESGDSGVIELAAYHLGKMESEATAAVEALSSVRDSENGMTRLHVAEALTRIDPNETESLEILLDSLQTGDDQTRWFVAVTLGNVSNDHTTTVVEALINALRDENEKVRSAAALSLGGLGKPAFPSINLLTELAETDTPQVKDAARAALSCLDSIE